MTGTAPGAELAPEEAALYRRARAGDGKARQQLALRHLPLVREIAGRFRRGGIDLEELVQSGTVGLLQALQGFDPDRGYRFSTYAVPFIVGEIRAFLQNERGLRAGRRLEALGRRLEAAQARLTQALGRSPTLGELAAEVGVEPDEAFQALEALREPRSLDEPVAPGEDRLLGEALAGGEEEEAWAQRLVVAQALERLTPRERIILRLRFWEGRNQQEVAACLGLSQPQVSRIERACLAKLRALGPFQEAGE
ncbi:sigma-70 family RNA polymerase sigma factor [Limnochorda sp.]|uniref:sigma-70 family RNA polymerase sigma factor n=1 Tax=Limnochorda sp. TaxID=1940279 RepID=UPI0017A672B7|nr:hypothetical protein [Bacillota bacterium]MBO2518906.1 hypothetical protein [Bacillota bacterium]NMA70524.1 sigma-70 family RNA polymerase sigma factor [Bacillota bacterium]